MRIVVAAPPKAGNSWLKCLLASTYQLDWLRGDESPAGSSLDDFEGWVGRGGFRDNSIFHHHYDYSEALSQAVSAVPAHLVTIIRDPYDSFVSLFYFVQAQASGDGNDARRRRQHKRAHPLAGKAIDDPAALAYLTDQFRGVLVKANEWLHSGRTVVVRYERLHHDPVAELTRATDAIAPVASERVVAAIDACQAATLLKTRKGLAKRIRTATVGDWRNRLNESHLAIFRDHHADLIRSLGYEVH